MSNGSRKNGYFQTVAIPDGKGRCAVLLRSKPHNVGKAATVLRLT